ncbi:2-amino-4-hydroxy-6-hydroxymethyldihydropteridine diphosphokinase [Alicyclobacillus shizuokensis]|uniref:2-amino-4-hydroxy-6- hydroxymethyldihydropteridine diphosphokinase n=1 Tax=Alicyclobacillus shizuokensis TaxID=392014 RepID=UPI0008353221|nr:2-amino-4-hydroxy-6-hydroxymethyldihydropteridine diphosphokinase [Alicyclobacillus shizuokensis]MCL6626951.1 2-amino-4-hydroxy-6-hydroxymethyldihydropteridine diphosphokinase [Alicyclobacillus shizuokensis]
MEPVKAYIGLGSNLGDRAGTLLQATERLQRLAIGPMRVSGVYETQPVGYVEQPDFLNLVVELPVVLPPLELLSRLQRIEADFGRVRDIRFGPRTLDLDILLYGDAYVCFSMLQVPHPRLWERAFALVPLAELVPSRRALGGGTISRRAERLRQEGGVRRVGDLRQAAARVSQAEMPHPG